MKLKYILLPLMSILFFLTGCRSSHTPSSHKGQAEMAETLVEKMNRNVPSSPFLSSRIKAELQLNGRTINCTGSLKMERGSMVRISLSFLGFEVGRLEFTPQDMLFVDRMHKQYMRSSYSKIAPLRDAELNFSSLQSVFWDQLWMPGQDSNNMKPLLRPKKFSQYTLSEAGDHALLVYSAKRHLDYLFLIDKKIGVIDRMNVRSKSDVYDGLLCSYANYILLNKQYWFPQHISFRLRHEGREVLLTLKLSSLSTKKLKLKPTHLSSSYSAHSLEAILDRLADM